MSEKVKTRFTALDVTAMVASLRKKLLGTRYSLKPPKPLLNYPNPPRLGSTTSMILIPRLMYLS